jgi:hypothetical protein
MYGVPPTFYFAQTQYQTVPPYFHPCLYLNITFRQKSLIMNLYHLANFDFVASENKNIYTKCCDNAYDKCHDIHVNL